MSQCSTDQHLFRDPRPAGAVAALAGNFHWVRRLLDLRDGRRRSGQRVPRVEDGWLRRRVAEVRLQQWELFSVAAVLLLAVLSLCTAVAEGSRARAVLREPSGQTLATSEPISALMRSLRAVTTLSPHWEQSRESHERGEMVSVTRCWSVITRKHYTNTRCRRTLARIIHYSSQVSVCLMERTVLCAMNPNKQSTNKIFI